MDKKTTTFPVIDLVKTGSCIEEQRRKAGLTVREVQAHFGFEYPQAIYKWQKGLSLPTIDNLIVLADVFDVRMDDIIVKASA
jgi:transcriptional regulator with XRE-family HTH domain